MSNLLETCSFEPLCSRSWIADHECKHSIVCSDFRRSCSCTFSQHHIRLVICLYNQSQSTTDLCNRWGVCTDFLQWMGPRRSCIGNMCISNISYYPIPDRILPLLCLLCRQFHVCIPPIWSLVIGQSYKHNAVGGSRNRSLSVACTFRQLSHDPWSYSDGCTNWVCLKEPRQTRACNSCCKGTLWHRALGMLLLLSCMCGTRACECIIHGLREW